MTKFTTGQQACDSHRSPATLIYSILFPVFGREVDLPAEGRCGPWCLRSVKRDWTDNWSHVWTSNLRFSQ